MVINNLHVLGFSNPFSECQLISSFLRYGRLKIWIALIKVLDYNIVYIVQDPGEIVATPQPRMVHSPNFVHTFTIIKQTCVNNLSLF